MTVGNWVILASGMSNSNYIASGLTSGLYYAFKVEAHNSVGYSPSTAPISIICTIVATSPLTPTTKNVVNNILVSWNAPNAQGSPITGYKVSIRNKVGSVFFQESVACNPTSVVSTTSCSIPISTL